MLVYIFTFKLIQILHVYNGASRHNSTLVRPYSESAYRYDGCDDVAFSPMIISLTGG